MATRSEAADWGGASRAVPPAPVEPTLRRPRLESFLDDAVARRIVTVVADAGFGKSTLLASWAQGRSSAWYTASAADREVTAIASGVVEALSVRVPRLEATVGDLVATGTGPDARADESDRAGAYAALLCEALERLLPRDLVLVIDDLSELGPTDPAARFVESLARMAPRRLHLVLASREDPPFALQRLRGRGQVASLAGRHLAFEPDETRRLLEQMLGRQDGRRLMVPLQEATGGWPAAVRLAAEALLPVSAGEREATLARVLRPGGPIYEYLAEEALQRVDPSVRTLLAAVADLPRFSIGLLKALGLEEAAPMVPALARRGLFVQPVGDDGWFGVHPLVRQLAPSSLAPSGPTGMTLAAAAAWFEGNGYAADAIACLQRAGDAAGLARVLDQGGQELLDRGQVEIVVDAISAIPIDQRGPRLLALAGEASQLRGDWDDALDYYKRAAAGADVLAAAIAWRAGIILHLRGQLGEALQTYARGHLDGSAPVDEAMLHAWWASALWLQGDAARSREHADAALALGSATGDDRALAAAHTVQAMLAALASDRRANDAHYLRALGHAARARDALQSIRIRANRGSHFAEEGYHHEALAELDEAIRLADLGGFAAFRALALSNRGEVLVRLGRLDEAILELEAARALYQRLDSRLVAYPLVHLGEAYRERGDVALARLHFEEAIRIAEDGGDLQGLVPALGGLARVIVRDEPHRALQLAERAVSHGPVLGRIGALLALGWVQHALGRDSEARRTADAARQLARERRDRAGLAEALELTVRSAADPAAERDRLDEACALWTDLSSPLGIARIELAQAELLDPDQARPLAEAARRRFTNIGARWGAASAGLLLDRLSEVGPAGVEIRTLGGFEVYRGGRPVTSGEWQSRKARALLKMLVAARGRRMGREFLIDTLWPDEDVARASPRLSVTLSTIRAVLDPKKHWPADQFVAGDRQAAWLRIENARVDLEAFHEAAERGLAEAGDEADARRSLEAAEEAYRGDFLNEDPYDDWATAPREEARAIYARVAHALAARSARDGNPNVAAGYLRRVLERDPFDEPAHLALVRVLSETGQHGESRRAYRAYVARMNELGVEAAALGDLPEPNDT